MGGVWLTAFSLPAWAFRRGLAIRRWVYWFISTLAVGGVAVAIALLAGPTGKRALPEGVGSAEAGGIKSCFPNNKFSETPGPRFTSSGSGTAVFTEGELNYPGRPAFPNFDQNDDEYFGGKIVWSFLQGMTQDSGTHNDPYSGDFGGFLVATIFWDNGDVTTFVSDCLYEVNTRGGSSIIQAKMGAQGWVTGFPDHPGKRRAIAIFIMGRENQGKKVQVRFAMTLGSPCNEGDAELSVGANSIQSAGFQETGVAAGVLTSPNSTAGARAEC